MTGNSLLVQVDWHQPLVPENWSVCMALYLLSYIHTHTYLLMQIHAVVNLMDSWTLTRRRSSSRLVIVIRPSSMYVAAVTKSSAPIRYQSRSIHTSSAASHAQHSDNKTKFCLTSSRINDKSEAFLKQYGLHYRQGCRAGVRVVSQSPGIDPESESRVSCGHM